mmetsp:Transcript_66325/g.158685  ORF Transcript_66325/g.158685 Transcript_66325/m.158685 type:complete len:142 (-) Transcript_66325:54-479(-)
MNCPRERPATSCTSIQQVLSLWAPAPLRLGLSQMAAKRSLKARAMPRCVRRLAAQKLLARPSSLLAAEDAAQLAGLQTMLSVWIVTAQSTAPTWLILHHRLHPSVLESSASSQSVPMASWKATCKAAAAIPASQGAERMPM